MNPEKEPHRVLITGGAGYIGSHITHLLRKTGHQVIVFDNLSTGNAWAISDTPLIQANILDKTRLHHALKSNAIQTVIHLAAKSSVPESFIQASAYFKVNQQGTENVIQACAKAGVQHLIFSSTAAVYGKGSHGLAHENTPLDPISPYGESKLAAERFIVDFCPKHAIKYAIFRFFNVIGAHPNAIIGQYNPTSSHLLKHCLNSIQNNCTLDIYGNDYNTSDGTAERDYIHVQDLANLHLQAIRHLQNHTGSMLLNAGYGQSHSVLKFIRTFEQVTKKTLSYQYVARRHGDPSALIADVSLLQNTIDWSPQYSSLETMIGSSYAWESSSTRRALA